VAGIGIAIGPISGGWLVEHASWSWIFLVNVPVVAIALLGGRLLVPESRTPQPAAGHSRLRAVDRRAHHPRVGDHRGARARLDRRRVLAAFGAAALALAAFVVHELRTREPMLDVRLFRNRRFSASSVAISLAFFALFGTVFFLTQYLQAVLGYSALEAGVRTLPVAAGLVLGGPLSAKLAERAGTKVVVASGLVLVATGLGLYGLADANSGYGIVALSQLVLGFGMGTAMAPGDGGDHGLAAAGEGERRLGRQRRHADHGRGAGRRRPRFPAVQRLPWRDGGRRWSGCPRRQEVAQDSLAAGWRSPRGRRRKGQR
jgi:MFS family permease